MVTHRVTVGCPTRRGPTTSNRRGQRAAATTGLNIMGGMLGSVSQLVNVSVASLSPTSGHDLCDCPASIVGHEVDSFEAEVIAQVDHTARETCQAIHPRPGRLGVSVHVRADRRRCSGGYRTQGFL